MAGLTTSEKVAEIGKALAAAQKEMTEITRSRTAQIDAGGKGRYSYTYAELSEVISAVLPALNKHGIAVVQSPGFLDDGWVVVETMLVHESGEWIRNELRMRPTQTTPQGVGSAITYARRYALQAMCGVAPEDDDGAAASAPPAKAQRVTPMQRSAPLRAAAEPKPAETVEDPTAPLTQAMYEHLKPVVDSLPREAVAECLYALTGRVDDFTQLQRSEAHEAYVALRKIQRTFEQQVAEHAVGP